MQQVIVPTYTQSPPSSSVAVAVAVVVSVAVAVAVAVAPPLSWKDRLNERENATSDVIKKRERILHNYSYQEKLATRKQPRSLGR